MFSLCNPSKHSHYINHFSQYTSTPTKKCRSQTITYLGAGGGAFWIPTTRQLRTKDRTSCARAICTIN